jgi:undecaprenyl-phosphate galactose phosphotransferase
VAINIAKLANTNTMTDSADNLSNQVTKPGSTDWILFFSWSGIVGKRIFDFVVSSILIVIFSPLLLALMLVVKLDSPGPAIFCQKRLGRYGQGFNCYKLRTMYENNPHIMENHFENSPENQETWEKFAKLRGNDPRVTRTGKWLRLWSLDELPQLINVLKGEMSLVGPRPYLPAEMSKILAGNDIIFSVLPGLTGLWQVKGRNEIDFVGRVQLEAWYVLNRSLRMDVAILFQTIPVVFSRKGAY